jgi:hypothetical protein
VDLHADHLRADPTRLLVTAPKGRGGRPRRARARDRLRRGRRTGRPAAWRPGRTRSGRSR